MAALTSVIKYSDGGAHRTVLYFIPNASSLDTVDIGADFTKAIVAMAFSPSAPSLVLATSLGGKSITLTAVGLLNDAVYLLVHGAGA